MKKPQRDVVAFLRVFTTPLIYNNRLNFGECYT